MRPAKSPWFLLLFAAATCPSVLAFIDTPASASSLGRNCEPSTIKHDRFYHASFQSASPSIIIGHSTALRAGAGAGAGVGVGAGGGPLLLIKAVLSQIRRRTTTVLLLLLAATAALFLSKRDTAVQALLWPGSLPDENYPDAPLPEGSLGCPFVGNPGIFSGSKDYGPMAGFAGLCGKFGDIFRTYTLGMPMVSISGVDNIKSALKHEFRPDGINTDLMGAQNLGEVFGQEGMLYESDVKKHGLLRRLVGKAMTPTAIGAAIPSIQEAASVQIENILEADTIEMEKVFNDYTLDIAWKQILGLELTEEEVPKFHRTVEDWSGNMMNPMFQLPFRLPGLMTMTKAGRARSYLQSKVEEKLAKLDRDGPDNSTLSKLYFATDDDGKTKLTRTQVVDNALLLIFAGSETSASTLTVASLILAKNEDAWKKVKNEQREICSEYGEELTPQALDKCQYLDAVIKETLRLQPVEVQEVRKVAKTIVVEGKQIPEGWYAVLNIKQTHVNDPNVYKKDGSHMDINKGFKPERWLDESTKPSAWMPFGAGQHRCIGERLSMAEMKVFLAMLARKVDHYDLVNNSDKFLWKKNTAMARPLDGVVVRACAA